MRAIEAKSFSGYGGLRQTESPTPQPAKDRVLIRVTAAGVTPLDHTILSGGHPRATAPLVLGLHDRCKSLLLDASLPHRCQRT